MQRHDAGTTHETAVQTELETAGWHVYNYGLSSIIGRTVYEHMNRVPYNMRPSICWQSDFVAIHREVPISCYVDAKTQTDNFPNWAVEQRSFRKAFNEQGDGMPVLFVWSDMSCSMLDDLLTIAEQGKAKPHNGQGTRGSTTPFYRFPKSMVAGSSFGIERAIDRVQSWTAMWGRYEV